MKSSRFLLVVGAVLMFGCGGNGKASGSGNGACLGDNPPPECGDDCTGDSDCPSGFYCGTSGCSADCQSETDCSDGQFCSARGQCVDTPADQPDANCPDIAAQAEPQTPTVLFLIDRSGSMEEDFDDPQGNDSDRWTELHRALTNLGGGGGVVDNLESNVVFGAMLYSSDNGFENGECPMLQIEEAALDNAADIDALIDENFPITGADTPTPESLTVAYTNFPATVTPTSPRVLVLATDGDPDTCDDADSNGQQGPRTASETAVQAGFDMGIQTYVLSVGTDATESHLNRMARLGLGQDPDTGTASAFVAEDAAELQAAFAQIINGTRTCIFDLDGTVTDAASGDVRLDGSMLVLGTDWTLNGDSAIELIGDACTTYLESPAAQLTAEFPCGGFVVE